MVNDCYLWDDSGLPQYLYTGPCPASANDRAGRDAGLPADPCFLLGNSRLTAFAHASGRLELISGERGWARLNHLPCNDCWNQATLTVNGRPCCLAGPPPGCRPWAEERFGAGYARYEGMLPDGIRVVRRLSVLPSVQPAQGTPAVLVEIRLTNTGRRSAVCTYTEEYLAQYCLLSAQEDLLRPDGPVSYAANLQVEGRQARAFFSLQARQAFVPAASPAQRHPYDCFPPVMYVQAAEGCGPSVVTDSEPGPRLGIRASLTLCAGESGRLCFVVGWQFAGGPPTDQCCRTLLYEARPGPDGAFQDRWAAVLPGFVDENDETLRWEMIWNAYVLRAMANYHAYFDATTVPQGSVYAYRLGQNTSVRDHLQHTLALDYLDPSLAKSSLRFVLQHECFDGRILRQDVGYGYEDAGIYMESDPQLYLFLAIGEYLRITGDLAFLGERVRVYPVEGGCERTVFEVLQAAFIWLRDVVRRGRHGLIMMRNSDWSDSFFHPYSPNVYAQVAESHLNTAMALVVLPMLTAGLWRYLPQAGAAAPAVQRLASEMDTYRADLLAAFMRDMEGKVWAPRCYIGFDDDPKLRFGEDRLCLEAQIWLLQIEEFPAERRQRLADAVWEKLIAPEKLGARTRERPLWNAGGHGEDGGMWFAHQGPLMVGLARDDKTRAKALMQRLPFHHIAESYPDYWVGHWTAPDSLESTLSDREGLYHAWCEHAFQPYCAHAHAWMYYCYCRLFAPDSEETP